MSNFWSVYSQSPEAAIAGTFDKDGKIKPPEKGQVQDIGKKLVEGQVPAMLAGSTSDIIDLAKVLNDLNAEYGGNTQLLSHLAKPLIDKVQSYAGRDSFTKGFNELAQKLNLPFRDDPNNPANTLGGLISIGGAYKLGKETVKSTAEAVKEVKNIFKGKGPPMGPQPELAGVGSVDDISTQTNKLLDKTPPPSQAKAQISPTVIGLNTATGKKQAKIFEELEAQNKFTPEELFERTGVYRSNRDGKLRYDLDDSNASLKLDIGDRANLIASGEPIRLEELFNFPELYKEYPETNILKKMQNKLTGQETFKPLKDITVKFVREPDLKFNAAYDTDTDSIMINMANMINDKDLIESKIIHEIQHAVQHREGFLTGGSSLDIIENLPRSDEYLQLVKKYGEDKDPLVGSIENFDIKKQQFFEDQLIDIAQSDPAYYKALVDDIDSMTFLGTRSDNTRFLEYLGELENKLLKETNLSENAITRIKGNLSKLVSDHRQEKIFIENMQATAMQQYKDLYGEREAKLVEQIYNRRKANKPSEKNLLVEELGGGQKNQKFDVQTKHNNIIQTSENLEKIPVKNNLALQKISEQFDKSELDANGIPKNILKDKDGKPLILYYGDSGYTYVPPKLGEKDTLSRKTAYVDKGLPGKLIDKFAGAKRIGKGNFTTTNPFLASTYASASNRGSVIPVYIMAEKVIDAKKIGVDGIRAFDAAADKLGKNEVIVGNFGFDANAMGRDNLLKALGKENYIKQMQEAGQKYTDTQYAFTGDTQVFSAISGEKLSRYNKGGIVKQMSNLRVGKE